jgi:hypothetical protein
LISLEAPGIEADFGQPEITIEPQSSRISTDADPADVPDRAPKCAIVRGVVTESSEAYELSNVVETALARALVLAAEARRWDVVTQIAEELEGRRLGMARARRRVKPARSVLSAYDLNMRERIAGRMMIKGAPSGPAAGMMNAPFSSFFVSVRSPLESVE